MLLFYCVHVQCRLVNAKSLEVMPYDAANKSATRKRDNGEKVSI